MLNRLFILVLVVSTLALSACNTVKGMGTDLENLGGNTQEDK